ncbi:SDR family NAD(P)-dependent oxidoreductase [Amycolatopsis acidicola]|uniref:SDR family NAD(P)-dependent oxidoreductase n=1 Tax=Amycolatopsis acidicola TaxID=2596893 RepID=UPI00140800B3|nr:SDR family NAD(P)-dependent oxidoreductase [Amycolatopsis acidicola]
MIVTGAGSGLGRAISLRLIRDGYRCILVGRNVENLEATRAAAGADGSRATVISCDVTDSTERDSLLDALRESGSELFGLVNNAGVAFAEPFFDECLHDWRSTMETNLEAVFFLSQHAIDIMRKYNAGRIVNISSAYGVIAFNNSGYGSRAPDSSPGDRGPFRQSAYAASKGGLIHLTRDLAATAGRWGITVNTISPGSIPHFDSQRKRTDQSDKPRLGECVDPEILRNLAEQVPLQRLGTVGEIAGPVRFLLSDDASYITGANIVVDGGWSIW